MPILDTLASAMGGNIADGIAKIIGLFKIDPTVALEKQVELQEIQLKMAFDAAAAVEAQVQGQINTNLAEAQSGDKFTSRWRPFIGYVCGIALLSNFVVSPFFTWITRIDGHGDIGYPTLDLSVMTPILLGMLGLGAMRSYDKAQSSGKED